MPLEENGMRCPMDLTPPWVYDLWELWWRDKSSYMHLL